MGLQAFSGERLGSAKVKIMSKSAPLVKGDGRDARGRFVKGYKGGPGGNPLQHRILRLKRSVLDAATPAQVTKVIKKLGVMAADGDVAAAKVYLAHVIGRPDHTYDPRQSMPADEQKRQGPQYTPQEQLIIARAMMREAERRLREQEPIEAEGEEVQDE